MQGSWTFEGVPCPSLCSPVVMWFTYGKGPGTLQVRHSEFLEEHLGEWPGPIIEQETGEVLGFHRGFWFHTIGQRKGVSRARIAHGA